MVLLQHHGGHRVLRLLTRAAIVVVAASCGDGARDAPSGDAVATAITNGATTTGDLGVVALVRGDTLVCTGTLVAPRVVLTAAHCVPDGAPPDVVFGATLAGTRVGVVAAKRHPTFDAATFADDVAMLLLADRAPSGATTWPLATAAPDVGLALRIVGFGRTASGDTSPAAKRVGTTRVASVGARDFTFAPSPSQTCEGDSGGPAFATAGGGEAIVGVTSSGDPACAQSARDVRVDAYAAFIAPWIAATADGAAGAGERCYYAAMCADAAACAPALDDAKLAFCAPACGANDACPAGLACLSDGAKRLCRHAPPSPGALGATCRDASDCAAASCVAPASGGASVCAPTCFADLPGFCTSGYVCAKVAGGASSACFVAPPAPSSSGGCRAARVADFDGGLAVALGVALTLWRRRQGGSGVRG